MTAEKPRGFGVVGVELRAAKDERLSYRLLGILALLEAGIAVIDQMSEDIPPHPLIFPAAYLVRMAHVMLEELDRTHSDEDRVAEQTAAAQPVGQYDLAPESRSS
jgi:hypothetical protein